MRRIKLTTEEAFTLEEIAKRSKMDDWFKVDFDANTKSFSVRERDFITLMEGATPYDLERLTSMDMERIINLFLKTLPKVKKTKKQ